jgi:hypothetical protein
MWYYSNRNPKNLLRAIWFIAKWLILGPVIGGALLALVGFLLVGVEGAINGLYIGLAFGTMGGAITAGSKAMAWFGD